MTFVNNDGAITANAALEVGIGLLGARVPCETMFPQALQAARDEMIERRILRIEMALRRAGIEVEQIPLPKGRP